MKTVHLFKKLINIYFYLLVISLLIVSVSLPILFTSGKLHTLDFNNDFFNISHLTGIQFFVLFFSFLSICSIFIASIYYIKESLNDLSQENYFSKDVIKNFNKSGRLMLLFGFSFFLFKIIFSAFYMSKIHIDLTGELLYSILIGLFLMFLSEEFEKGRKTKEENDLTI